MSEDSVTRRVEADISNYYGGPALNVMRDGTYRLDVENWDGWCDEKALRVSEEFAKAWLKEFDKGAAQ